MFWFVGVWQKPYGLVAGKEGWAHNPKIPEPEPEPELDAEAELEPEPELDAEPAAVSEVSEVVTGERTGSLQ